MKTPTKILVSFVVVCLAWGASYFSIRIGLRSMPPLLMGSVRYGVAGLMMWGWCDFRRIARPTAKQWMVSAFLGTCFVVVGNGTVLWAEQSVPSGITALLVAVTPIGTILFEWLFRQRTAPGGMTWLGLLMGLGGVMLMVASPTGGLGCGPAIIVLLGTIGWSLGSAASSRLDRPDSPLRSIAAQMLCGSFILSLLGLAMGESHRLHPGAVTADSFYALMYLILVASIAAYIAYTYLMQHVSPTAAGVCSYVNPMIAMLIGSAFGEPIGMKEVLALGVVLMAVTLVAVQELRRRVQIVEDAQVAIYLTSHAELVEAHA